MIRRTGLLLLTAAALAAAADPAAAILDQARGAPVEIFTDVVFSLLDAKKVPPKDRMALLDEVFLRAGEAHQPMAQGPAVLPKGRGAFLGDARLRLDALAIQSRVVKAMLEIDGQHARELFGQIHPDVSKPDCAGAIIQDPSDYYDLLAAVVTKAPFTAKEQADQVPFWTVESAVRSVHTSVEIVAAARNLSHLAHTEKEALAMSAAFAAALGIDDSNRNFSAAVRNNNVVDAVLGVAADRFAKLGAHPQAMQSALRGFLVRHLTASRCADTPDGLYDSTVAAFNAAIGHQPALPPITAEESTPAKVEGAAEPTKPVDHSEFDSLQKAVDAVAKDPAATDLAGVLEKIQAWKGAEGENPVAVFHNKVGMYLVLLGMNVRRFGPSGLILPDRKPGHEAVLAALIATLSDPAIPDLSPEDWLSEVRPLKQQRFFTWVNDEAAGEFREVDSDIVQAMLGSSLSALQVYGKMAVLEHSRAN